MRRKYASMSVNFGRTLMLGRGWAHPGGGELQFLWRRLNRDN
jgi:hypothetical protein